MNNSRWAGTIGAALLILFTVLLCTKQISEASYVVCVTAALLIAVAVAVLPRLQEFDLKNAKLVLAKLEKTKAEIEEMYGGIENIKRNRKVINYEQTGTPTFLVGSATIRNYVSGCMKRERERLAMVFVKEKSPEKIAEAVLDSTYDVQVFKWANMGSSLNDPIPEGALSMEPAADPPKA